MYIIILFEQHIDKLPISSGSLAILSNEGLQTLMNHVQKGIDIDELPVSFFTFNRIAYKFFHIF